MKEYNINSIETLDAFEHMRKYPGMYIGSKDEDGLLQCVKEVISNSVDEYMNGAGSEVIVRLLKNNGIFISDNGRGIPHGKHETGCSLLQSCFGIPNTGAKFNKDTGKSGYNTSGGQHGTGGKAVNAVSKSMIVTTANNGLKEIVEFSKGKFVSENKIKSDENGVSVTFYPDEEIFDTTVFNVNKIKTLLEEFSFLNSGLKFSFSDENTGEKIEYLSENGLKDYLDYLNKGKETICQPFHFVEREGTFKVEVAFVYNSTYTSSIKVYTNNIPQVKGTHLTGFKTALTSTMNSFAKEQGWYKKGESNLTGSDYEEGLMAIVNFTMIDPVLKGQHKEELSSSEGRTYVQKFTTLALKDLFEYNSKDAKRIFDKAMLAKKGREASKRARDSVRKTKGKRAKILDLPTKLVDCECDNRMDAELYICEGDSAASGMVAGRTALTQAIFPIRGKMINPLKSNDDKVMSNQEIINLKKALGLDSDSKGKLIYDKKKLRYGKIITGTDADPDGANIITLIISNLWYLCPELILNGHLYIGYAPLYRITTSKNEYIYLKDDKALNEYKQNHTGEKYRINRMKGLGEADAKELREILLDEKTRNVKQIVVEDKEEAEKHLYMLMGTSVDGRKSFLLENGYKAKEVY